MSFRTRKNGQHYPITPKVVHGRRDTDFSPQQLLNMYNSAPTVNEKMRYKKAAVSQANKLKAAKLSNREEEYRQIIKKMTVKKSQLNTKDFMLKKDYGKVKLYTYSNREYLIGDEIGVSHKQQIAYARKIQKELEKLPVEDTQNIKHVVIDPDNANSGELIRGQLTPHIYDKIGKKEAMKFVKQHEKDKHEYGLVFGSEFWDENKNQLSHLVAHEVGHLKRYNITDAERLKIDQQYQQAANHFLQLDDPDIKRRIEHVQRISGIPVLTGVEGEGIMKIEGLSNTTFKPELWEKYKIPSIYSMASPSEYSAETYAFRQDGKIK